MISVLYVDDETDLLEIGKLFLERIGTITVDIVNSAQDALRRLAASTYDVIVSDYQMPGMDGIELLQKIRAISDIPFILFTGRGREEVVIRALDCGADYYVQKGGNPNAQFAELSHDIHQIAKHRSVEAALCREQEFSRALLKNLAIDHDDLQQVEALPCPVLDHQIVQPNRVEADLCREQSSRALLKTLMVGPEDLYRVAVLPSPTTGPSRQPLQSGSAGGSPVSPIGDLNEAGPLDLPKGRNLKTWSAGLFDTIHHVVKGERSGSSLSRELVNRALLEDLVTGPEDLYRIGILPSPVWEPIRRSRHSVSC